VENLDAQLRKLLVATESLVFYRKALTGHTYMVSKSLGKDTNQCCGSGIRCLFDPGIRDG
jgi:hypothetical protein